MTRYLVAGAGGMLGTDLVAALQGRDTVALTRAELDITDRAAVRRAARGVDAIINCAAYTRVDDAETNEEEAFAINASGAENLAIAAAENDARLVQLSTDYVFDGTATVPYAEDAPLRPVSAYGRTKAEGERLALAANPGRTLIVRTAWLYGKRGSNFPKTMLALAGNRDRLSVVSDQLGQPTWSADVASHIVALLDSAAPGPVYHATNSGATSWFEFARAVFQSNGLDPDRIEPTDAASFARPAPRPAYSVLAHGSWERDSLRSPRPWGEALEAATRAGVFA